MPDNITTDPALYTLFERVVREAPPATEYRVNRTGTRQNGSTFRYNEHLKANQKDQLPWGTHDAIIDVTWWAPDWAGVPNKEFVTISAASHYGGILVITTFERRGHVVRLAEREHTGNRLGHTYHDRTSEDAVIGRVLEFIQAAVDEANATHDSDDEFDDRSRYDPLDERNYRLSER